MTDKAVPPIELEIDLKLVVLGGVHAGPDGPIEIPPASEDGQVVQSDGPNAKSFRIKVRKSSIFRRLGRSLELDFPISLAEAVLGGEARVPTLDGAVMLKLPAGLTTGSKLRIRGKGVPTGEAGGARGDQLVVIQVAMPAQIDPELEEDIRAWSTRYAYDPRAGFPASG